jgi:hypothetical protein
MIHGLDLLDVAFKSKAPPGKYEQQTAQRIPLVSGGLSHGKTKTYKPHKIP